MGASFKPWRIVGFATTLGAVAAGAIAFTAPPQESERRVANPALHEEVVSAQSALEPPGPPPNPPNWNECRAISLEEARRVLLAQNVVSVWQPHEGDVAMVLASGDSVCFAQPRLDWVVNFIDRNGLTKAVAIIME